ncbi:cytochrome b/b6 domain-containing protein [Consotaella salsifontis]|uniref:Cytochrome b n=1 Tax=Consotaella salsifontis TaxID=1365950 RepID=A0A1T4SM98_9HYPH|nr:cytochrome b/b6 domain-containing protein [Consotaella salsifontis]SKA29349.1 Cytochrome b [Consotaella salsifontis]
MTRIGNIGRANRFAHAGETVRVWDPAVRLFHWTVVAGVCLNLFVLEEGKTAHRAVGYVILGSLAFRLVWGFVGSRYARFSDFIPTPRRLARYIHALRHGEEPRFLGHNPLGAIMMLILMLVLAATGATGYMMTLDAFWGVRWVKEAHEILANSILYLALVHALAALVEGHRHGENLVLAMITGDKRAED